MSEFEKWYRNPTRPVAVPPVPGPASFLEEHARAAWNAALAAAEAELSRCAPITNQVVYSMTGRLKALKSEGAGPR